MQSRSSNSLKLIVLICQAALTFFYAVFFAIAPAILDNPEDHRENVLFLVPSIAFLISILGFFYLRVSAMLMMAYVGIVYLVLVALERADHRMAFAHALAPVWPPLIAGVVLFWTAKRSSLPFEGTSRER
jgi:hypothetical protein